MNLFLILPVVGFIAVCLYELGRDIRYEVLIWSSLLTLGIMISLFIHNPILYAVLALLGYTGVRVKDFMYTSDKTSITISVLMVLIPVLLLSGIKFILVFSCFLSGVLAAKFYHGGLV